jgi:hypothetical protein
MRLHRVAPLRGDHQVHEVFDARHPDRGGSLCSVARSLGRGRE